MEAEQFLLPIMAYTRIVLPDRPTGGAAHDRRNKSGVIVDLVSALPARMGSRLNGGYGSANAAKEALTRDLSAELAPQGIRVVGLRPHGMPETGTMREVFQTASRPRPRA